MKPITELNKPPNPCIDLDANQVIPIQSRHGTSILCVHGQVWVTQEGDLRDYILPRGLRFVAPGPGPIVVNGTAEHSRIMVDHLPSARRGVWARQPLQIDSQCFAQIESEARRARSTYFATILDAFAERTKRAGLHLLRWLAGSIKVAVQRKSKENT